MKRLKRSLPAVGLSGLFLAIAGPAAAQPAIGIEDSVVEGPGHPLGEGAVIHPHLSLETGLISNVFYEENDPVLSPVARLIGGISIASQNAPKPTGEVDVGVQNEGEGDEEVVETVPSKMDFRLGAELVFIGYPTGNDRARDQTNLGGVLDGQVVVNPAGDVVFSAEDTFVRDTRPKNFESFGGLNRDFNHANLGLMFRPGGHALGFGVRYENTLDRFENSGSSFANRLQHLVGARAEWKYLPLTKFYFDASLGFFGALGDSMGYKQSSMPLRIQLGIGTALTWATTLIAHIGYANGFYSNGPSFNMVIGGAELGYRYTRYGRVRFAVEHEFQDSMQANYFRDIAFTAKLDQQAGLFVFGGDVGVRLRGYRGISPVIGASSRDDVVFDATVRGAYLLRDNFALTARVQATLDETDYMYSAPPVTDSPKFRRFEGVVGATAAF
jgi:hypothetical protein